MLTTEARDYLTAQSRSSDDPTVRVERRGTAAVACKTLVTLLTVGSLLGFATNSMAQTNPAAAPAQQTAFTVTARTNGDKTKADFNKNNIVAWNQIVNNCTTATPECAQAAIAEVSTECSIAGKFFKKDTKKWEWINFALIMSSAAFTAVGASATIANAKVFSTLGGTTGLGAVTTTINANAASDQAGLAAVNTVLQNFLKFVQTGGPSNGAATDDSILKAAPVYASQCSLAANASTGTAPK